MPTLLLRYWPYLLAAGGVLVVFLYWNGRNAEIAEYKVQIANQQAEIVLKDAQYAENERRFKGEIEDTNRKIKQANSEYKALEQKSAILVAAADARNDERITKLQEQLKLLGSVPTPQTCEASIDLLVDIGVANPWPTK